LADGHELRGNSVHAPLLVVDVLEVRERDGVRVAHGLELRPARLAPAEGDPGGPARDLEATAVAACHEAVDGIFISAAK
jgi:hypothetical protein